MALSRSQSAALIISRDGTLETQGNLDETTSDKWDTQFTTRESGTNNFAKFLKLNRIRQNDLRRQIAEFELELEKSCFKRLRR